MKPRIRRSDALYSLIIRERNPHCEMCKSRFSSQVHHYFSRRYENTRFDDMNVVAVCFTCHRKFHEDPEIGRNFMLKKLGKRGYVTLRRKTHIYKRRDDKMDYIWLKERKENDW